MMEVLKIKDIKDEGGYKARHIPIPNKYIIVTGLAPKYMGNGIQPMTKYKLAMSSFHSLIKGPNLTTRERVSLEYEFGYMNKFIIFVWIAVDDGSYYYWGCHDIREKPTNRNTVFIWDHIAGDYIPSGCQWIIYDECRRVRIEKAGCFL